MNISVKLVLDRREPQFSGMGDLSPDSIKENTYSRIKG
jgi:hypothetical protein